MATPQEFARDWVFDVIAPFLTQLKNRIGNIRTTFTNNVFTFYNGENVATQYGIKAVDTPYRSVNVVYPRFARRGFNGSGLEGYIVIMLPESVEYNTMMSLFIDVFIYKTNRSFSCVLSGYNYQSNHWYQVTTRKLTYVHNQYKKVKYARFLKTGGDANNDDDYTRFGFIIGADENSQIPYVKIAVSKCVLGHQNYDTNKWDTDDWYIDLHDDSDMPPHKVDYTKNMG